MYVSDMLKSKGGDVIAVDASDPVGAALKMMVENQIGAVLVKDALGGIAGILSERDLVRAVHEHGAAVVAKTVGELMTTQVVTCGPQDPVAGIMAMMTAHRFRHVPVVDDGRVIGMISIGDVVKNRIEEAQSEVDALRRYIAM